MSRSKISSAQRRTALLAGSALVAASLGAGSALFMPQVAFAANECGPGPTVTCAAGTYAGGITYNSADSVGDLSVTTLGAITAGNTPLGIDINGSGAADVTLNTVAGALSGTGGVDVVHTGSGDVTVSTGTVAGGVRASTSGVGLVTVNGTSSAITAASTSGVLSVTNTTGTVIASTTSGLLDINNTSATVTATTTSGAIDIEKTSGNVTATSTTGAITLSRTGFSSNTVSATTRGNITIGLGGAGAVTTNTSGGAGVTVINTNLNTTASLNLTTGTGSATVNNIATVGNTNTNSWDNLVLSGQGSGPITVNNSGVFGGRIDLSAYNGDFTLNASGTTRGWGSLGVSTLARGDNTINNAADSVMAFGAVDQTQIANAGFGLLTTTLVFQNGEDVFNNAGAIVLGAEAGSREHGSTFIIRGLEDFNNSGTIVMGGKPSSGGGSPGDVLVVGQTATDRGFDDVFVLEDGRFTGLEGSRIVVDALFNNTGQTDCSRNVDDLPDGNVANRQDGLLRANDCLDFRGSQVSGQTGIIFADVLAQDRGAYNPDGNVVVDVRGGVVDSPDAFVVSPDTPGYIAVGNGGVDKGLFAYVLGFDAEDGGDGGQFKIYGVEAPTSQQFPLLAQAAGEVWRAGAAAWTDRRAGQRDGEEYTRRAWLRVSAGTADRTSTYTVMAGDTALDFDNNHTIDTTSVTIGYDLGRMSLAGGEWVVGAMFGYGRAEVSYEAIDNTGNIEGVHAGLYSGFTAGPFFQDLVVDALSVGLENDAPALGLVAGSACNPDSSPYFPACIDDPNSRPILDTEVRGLGVNADTGWRFMLADRLSLEPMVSLQWLHTELDEMNVPADDPTRLGGKVSFDDARSLRAGLGLRLGMDDIAPGVLPVNVRLTARSMQEWDGEATVRIVNVGPDTAVVTNTFDGTFNEVSAAVSFGEGSDHVSGFINVSGVWSGDYESRTASTGLRLRW